MVFDGITEFLKNWLQRARRAIHVDVESTLCVEDCFIRPGTRDEILVDRIATFEVCEPSIVAYEPYPLVFQCAGCSRVYEAEKIQSLRNPPQCACGRRDAWRQVDVVFAHWSGELEPLSPSRYWWDEQGQRVVRRTGCGCGANDFYLLNKAPTFSEWSFRCASCGAPRELYQLSRLTASTLEPKRGTQAAWREPIRLDENMLPVSYRASSLHYVQTGRFIAIDGLDEGSWLELFLPGREPDLLRAVAAIHGFSVRQPAWSEVRGALIGAGRTADWDALDAKLKAIDLLGQRPEMSSAVKALAAQVDVELAALRGSGAIPAPHVDSPQLAAQLARQADWARRHNPIRLTVEHDAFKREYLGHRGPSGSVNVLSPDRRLFQFADNPEDLRDYQTLVSGLQAQMGVQEISLIRRLAVVEYSFGFSRVSATPVYARSQGAGTRPMPVRLCAFPQMHNGRRPVYVMEQQNEALYIRLSPEAVRRWLTSNGVSLAPAAHLGQAYLENYEDFGEFLERYKVRDAPSTARSVPNFTYALLHTLSHAFLHSIADYSGLDTDALGEHVYPPDLAIVVYRKGMTPDLGNIGSMWRNRHRELLEAVLSSRRLRCGSGSLCDHRGGACPACIMVSDIGCLAHNQLLSRSLLAGGRAPTWDSSDTPVIGYFEAVQAAA
jgi:hypothetical protein